MSEHPSIAVVVLDTLRTDAFDEAFDWLPGARFADAWAPSHWTVPVHASLFAGKYATELGVHVDNQQLDCPEPVLAELLADAGYRTRAFSCNPNVSTEFDFDRGFDEFEGSWRLRNLDSDLFDWPSFLAEHGMGRRQFARGLWRCVREDCATWPSIERGVQLKRGTFTPPALENEDDGAREVREYATDTDFGDREFLFVNLMETHAPYAPPEEYLTVGPREEVVERTAFNGLVATISDGPPAPEGYLRQAYGDAVRYLSDAYRDIFAELRASFDYVVTLSDHGELLGEHGGWQHSYGLYPELTKVPLVVSGDGIADRSLSETVSLLDVHATVLSLAGIDAPSDGSTLVTTDGAQPTVAPPDRTCFTEYHGLDPLNREAAVKRDLDPAPFDERLFGVKAPSAPYAYETRDGIQGGEGDAADTRDLLDQHRSQIDARTAGSADDVSEEVRRQLEDLGYA